MISRAAWIDRRVDELWANPQKVCIVLDDLFCAGAVDAARTERSAKAHEIARLLCDDNDASHRALFDYIAAALRGVAADEYEELPE